MNESLQKQSLNKIVIIGTAIANSSLGSHFGNCPVGATALRRAATEQIGEVERQFKALIEERLNRRIRGEEHVYSVAAVIWTGGFMPGLEGVTATSLGRCGNTLRSQALHSGPRRAVTARYPDRQGTHGL